MNAVNRGKISMNTPSQIYSVKNLGDDTPLHLAVSHNHFDIVQQVNHSLLFNFLHNVFFS